MRVVELRERSVAISRYRDPAIPSGGLTTSIVALLTDVMRDGEPVVGFGFSSVGRFAQGGLIRERFAPRLLNATAPDLADGTGANLDPLRAWDVMMKNEKPGGHGERCVAVGTLDMALWDAAAIIARAPLYRLLADRLGTGRRAGSKVPVYAVGSGLPASLESGGRWSQRPYDERKASSATKDCAPERRGDSLGRTNSPPRHVCRSADPAAAIASDEEDRAQAASGARFMSWSAMRTIAPAAAVLLGNVGASFDTNTSGGPHGRLSRRGAGARPDL